MANGWTLKIGLTIIAGALGLIAFNQMYQWSFYAFAPLRIVATTTETPTVKFGDNIVIVHHYVRTSLCKVDIDRFIVMMPDLTLVRRERLPAGTTSLGEARRRIIIPTKINDTPMTSHVVLSDVVARNLVPGDYLLREFVHSDCGDRIHTTQAPDIIIKVVE